MFKYCIHCQSVVEVTKGKCCGCGQQLISDNDNNSKYYLPEPCDVRAEQVKQLWEQACKFMTLRNLNAADRLCGKILCIFPDHDDAKHMQEEIQSRFRRAGQFYEAIKNGIGNQSLDNLTSLLKEVTTIYPEHVDSHLVQVQLMSATAEYKNAMLEGNKAFGEGYWQKAQTHFERARQLNPGCATVKQLVDLVNEIRQQVETARSNIDTALAKGNRWTAMSLARSLDQYIERVKKMVKRS